MIRRAIKGTIRPQISRSGFAKILIIKILIGAFQRGLVPEATISRIVLDRR